VSTRAFGVALAFCTAVISGVSIYVNSYAVKHFTDATVYTTAKNAVAGALLVVLVLALRNRTPDTSNLPTRNWRALVTVAVVGGSVPFILFFEGLQRAEATQASFIQKTLVVWVAILAVPFLHERLGWPHLLAIAFLILGQAWLVGSAGTITFGTGEAMILAATLLWAVGPIRAIATGTLAIARMGLGVVVLVGWVAVSGKLHTLLSLDGTQLKWVLITGLLLSLYVATWYAALARAQAVDVTAMLVFGAVVTAGLSGTLDGAHVSVLGTGLIAAGSALAAYLAVRRPQVAMP
jgi:drug/metabolite transporter (DMT)-like permease